MYVDDDQPLMPPVCGVTKDWCQYLGTYCKDCPIYNGAFMDLNEEL